MITCHRNYKEAISDYAITVYFWGFGIGVGDISDLAEIERVLIKRLSVLRDQLSELDNWATRTQPILVHTDSDTEGTAPRGNCIPVKSPETTYIESRPAGIFDSEEVHSTRSAGRLEDHLEILNCNFGARKRLRGTLNDEYQAFVRECEE